MTRAERHLQRKLKMKPTMTCGMFWSEFVTKAVGYFCAVILMTMVLSAVLQMSTEKVTQITEYAAVGLAVLWCIPILRNTRRRLRDAGYSAKTYLWLLLPVVGWIIFIVCLCAKSLPRKADGTLLI